MAFGDGSVTEVAVIDLANLAEGQDSVQVCTIVAPNISDATYSPEYQITLGESTYGISADGRMSVADLTDYVTSTYGKRPTERDITATLSTWANNGTTAVKLTSGTFAVKVIPEAPYISQNYYLIGGPSEWSTTCTTLPFSHSSADVYDDPEFTIMFPVSDEDVWFAIIDDVTLASGEWSDVLGCAEGNGNNGMEGKIDRRCNLSDDGSWKITVSGDAKFVKMTINMMDYTYKLEKINFGEYIYEIGNESGWAVSHPLRGANYDGKYQGYYYLDGQFKFKPNADNWDGDYEYAGEGKLTQTGSDNIPAPDPSGFYQIDVDLTQNTYALTQVTSISAIGDFNSWGGDVDLTYNQSTGAWEATDVALSGGVKFRMNHDWSVSWGGNGSGSAFDNLTQNNGANLSVEAGTYDIQLFISYEGANKVVLTKK